MESLDDGMKCVTKGAIGVSELIKITEEEKLNWRITTTLLEAPPGPYKVQPDVQGKFFDQAPQEWENPTTAQIQERMAMFIMRRTAHQDEESLHPSGRTKPLDGFQVNQKNLKGPECRKGRL